MRALLLLLLLPALAGATAEKPLKATLTEAHGTVEVSTGAAWAQAEVGEVLASASRVKTGADGAADILFEDGTALHLDKNASLSLESARETADKKEFSIRLWAGRLLSQVMKKDKAAEYKVYTPVAVAAVRGTEFVTDAGEAGTSLAVFEGEVETRSLKDAQPLGEAVSLTADQELSVERGRPLGRPRTISRAMRDYRAGAASLFRARMDLYRRDMSRVHRLQRQLMERRQRRIQEGMGLRRRGNEGKMREFRRRTRRRTAR